MPSLHRNSNFMPHNALHRAPKDFPLSVSCNSQEDPCKTPELTATHGPVRPMNMLIVDDEPTIRRTLKIALESMGHHVADAKDSAQALELVSHRPFEVAFLDMRLGQERGVDLLPEMLRLAPGLTVIIFTAYATIENAVEAMRRGLSAQEACEDSIRHMLRRQSHAADMACVVLALGRDGQFGAATTSGTFHLWACQDGNITVHEHTALQA